MFYLRHSFTIHLLIPGGTLEMEPLGYATAPRNTLEMDRRGMRLLRERCWRWSAIGVCDFSEKDVGRSALDNGLVGLNNGHSRARAKARS
jgi:hypothetical protein